MLNGDDLYGADDLDTLSQKPADCWSTPVDEPKKFGIVFSALTASLERMVEKPDLTG